MRFSVFILAGLIAVAAAAQDAPPAEPPAETKAEPGLSDLSTTVEQLQDAPPSSEVPAESPQDTPPPAESTPEPQSPVPIPQSQTPSYVPPLTSVQREQLAAASARGRLLGAIDQAGRIATQDMLSRVADPGAAGIAGWIAEPQGNGVTVTFYAAPVAEAPPGAVFRANILGGRVVSREVFLAPEGRPALSAPQARMAAARAVAAAQTHRPCGGDVFNYFVVPPAGATAPIEVYSISPQTARGRFPLGGHFRTAVAPDGSVAETRGFANACLDLEVAEMPAGQRPPPLAVTHLLDPLPTELHAFLAIWTGRPLVVVAGDPQRLFGVTGEGMGELPREPGRGR